MYKKKSFVIYKRSQITLMVILGIVALISFSMIAFVTKVGEEERVEDRVTKLASEKVQAAAVESHVNFCLDKALEDGLILIAGQGGYIHKHQPGSVLTWETTVTDQISGTPVVNYKEDNKQFEVGYRINKDPLDILPRYPCKQNTNPPNFCKFSNNILLFPDLGSYDFGIAKPLFLDYGPFSIENQLKHYIQNQTIECINFSRFRTFEIAAGAVNASVKITDEEVTAIVKFPLTIQVSDYYPVIKLYKFASIKKVKLRKFHEAITEIIKHDSRYLDFDLKENTLSGKKIDGKPLKVSQLAVLVEKIEGWSNNFDDFFKITDTSSKLGGKHYTYQFMRANRPPVLDFISGNVAIPEKYDYIALKGTELILVPTAKDPDEDKLTFSYSGWNHIELMKSYWWKQPGSCLHRCANITLNTAGEFNITIKVSDGQYTDYQIFRIKVEESTAAHGSSTSVYPQLESGLASIEDPHILDAGGSLLEPDSSKTYYYVWTDETTNEDLSDSDNEFKCIVLPSGENCSDPNINIRDMTGPFNEIKKHDLKLEIKTKQSSVDSIDVEVDVKECIPFRSQTLSYPYHNITGNKFLSSGNDLYSGFLGDHTCCIGDMDTPSSWEYAGIDKECFNYELKDTCYPYLPWQRDVSQILGVMPVTGKSSNPEILEPISSTNIQTPSCASRDCMNDIYSLSLTQKCSNKRGNACSGDSEFKWKLKKTCADDSTQAEACVGPGIVSGSNKGPVPSISCPLHSKGLTIENLGCYNYQPGESFEKSFLGTGTGACKTEKKCSYLGPGGYGAVNANRYLCSAACNGAGGCDATSLSVCFDCDTNEKAGARLTCENNVLKYVNDDWFCNSALAAHSCNKGTNTITVNITDECKVQFYKGCEYNPATNPVTANYRDNITLEEQGQNRYNIPRHYGQSKKLSVGCSNDGTPHCLKADAPDTSGKSDNDGDGWEEGCDADDDNPCKHFSAGDNCGKQGCSISDQVVYDQYCSSS